ncbi:zinc-binding dehydrogenase [Herbiconiux sp. VKM Ac-1786]|nr:zinc-binding dehydrogenase [Herbiconiux sp. VKM Ac-1786]
MEVVLPGLVEPEGLIVHTTEVSPPAPGHAVLRMEATGVSFAEQQMRRGRYYGQPAFPFVPGYDVVGTVIAVGPGVSTDVIGRRFAAVTKIGAWADVVDVDARALMPVPVEMDAAEIESIIVNGITAWRMLYEVARVRSGGTILVLGANGGVGSTLVQLANAGSIRVVGTASLRHHDLLRDLGAEPVDYTRPDMHDQLRDLAPSGYDAVFDHIGGAGITQSWALVRRGGALVSYGTAAAKDDSRSVGSIFFALFTRLAIWNALPNGRRASFFDFWKGVKRPSSFYRQIGAAFAEVLGLLESSVLRPQVAARFSLTDTVRALQLAESRTVAGKVVLLPA